MSKVDLVFWLSSKTRARTKNRVLFLGRLASQLTINIFVYVGQWKKSTGQCCRQTSTLSSNLGRLRTDSKVCVGREIYIFSCPPRASFLLVIYTKDRQRRGG